ncbi:MAG: ABC transporter permease [Pirellulaceae bacterium]|nr:ABC transporter permease [Planctomycetales bacterium]
MFKLLLCQRYLRTRFIALASIVSVTLGVATMIVVNSVMDGFQAEMYQRLHGILSDVVLESYAMEGITDPQAVMADIRKILGDDVAGMTATVQVPAVLSFKVNNQWQTRHINLIGIDRETYAHVSDFSKYLLNDANRDRLSFELHDGGYDARLGNAGWSHRRARVRYEQALEQQMRLMQRAESVPQATAGAEENNDVPADPFAALADNEIAEPIDPLRPYDGMVLGIAICSVRARDQEGGVNDYFFARPGDDVKVTFPTAGTPPKAVSDVFTVVDLYESKMSEYDSTFAFVPLERLQKMRGMIDPQTQRGAVSAIQIKLKPDADLDAARDRLRDQYPAQLFHFQIQTWKDMQGPLLAAVKMETTILNILLFMIIAVAGFGILATFYMIVVEKTRDIGILKSLGAPNRGVMAIFLGYGLSLGCVGSGVGMVLGLLFVVYINNIAELVGWITGREVFDPTIYYFQQIPTIINPWTVMWIMLGAMGIAVLSSVMPALRAARLHPVEALRYE